MTTATEVAIAAARVRAYEAALPFAEEDDRREQSLEPARPIAVEEAESDLARALRDLICRAETRLAELGEGS